MTLRRGITGSERVRSLEQNADAFWSEYEERVEAIRDGCPESIPGYIERDEYADTYMFVLRLDGVVIKIPKGINDKTAYYKNNERVQTLLQAQGISYLEQWVGYSLRSPFVVTEYVYGTLFEDMLVWKRETMSDECYEELIRTFGHMATCNLVPDRGPDNFIFNHQRLTVIDPLRTKSHRTLEDVVMRFADYTLIDRLELHGNRIPPYARRFQEVCGRVLGAQVFKAIEESWKEWERDCLK